MPAVRTVAVNFLGLQKQIYYRQGVPAVTRHQTVSKHWTVGVGGVYSNSL